MDTKWRGKFCLAILPILLWANLTAATELVGMTAIIDTKVKENTKMVRPEESHHEQIFVMVKGRPFQIVAKTEILDKEGLQISIDRLAVPCKARIIYQLLKTREPIVTRLMVQQLQPNATAAWPPVLPR